MGNIVESLEYRPVCPVAKRCSVRKSCPVGNGMYPWATIAADHNTLNAALQREIPGIGAEMAINYRPEVRMPEGRVRFSVCPVQIETKNHKVIEDKGDIPPEPGEIDPGITYNKKRRGKF